MDGIIQITPRRVIASPCVNVCVIDQQGRLCTGCYRTLDEIAAWSQGSDAWRRAVMAALPERKAASKGLGGRAMLPERTRNQLALGLAEDQPENQNDRDRHAD